MRRLLLSLAVFATVAAMPVLVEPVHAAPAMQPVTSAIATLDQSAVQTVQYSYNRRELRRREELRRRREFRRRQAARRAYRRGY